MRPRNVVAVHDMARAHDRNTPSEIINFCHLAATFQLVSHGLPDFILKWEASRCTFTRMSDSSMIAQRRDHFVHHRQLRDVGLRIRVEASEQGIGADGYDFARFVTVQNQIA